MQHWQPFFEKESDLNRAIEHQLERTITIFPWIAIIDKFQHWIYTHVGHTDDERTNAWIEILNEFSTGITDWSGFEDYRSHMWQKQLHLFEVPFYYIEYGIAQLGALAMWRQYRTNKEQAIKNYMNALSQGYTKPLNELYQLAGISFDLSPAYVASLASFMQPIIDDMLERR
jgi:oligoendopeptidase F